MDLLEIKNRQCINKKDIPQIEFSQFENIIFDENKRVISLFVENNTFYAILINNENTKLYLTTCPTKETYQSFSIKKPCLQMFEREIYETTGSIPQNHPFLKPVRTQKNYQFLKSEDLQTHEVAVGPVHAGIIEPGHFRFLCNGERVNHLEIMLGYQHKNVEDLIKNQPSIQLSESICGDCTISYTKTFAENMESLSSIDVDEKSKLIRQIALEMERVAIHLGDLGAIAGDVAYQIGANVFAVTRTLVINAMLDICGNRFGKGLIKLGGVNYDITPDLVENIKKVLDEVKQRTKIMADAMFSNATLLSRLENTGVITTKRAKEIGLVGMAARSCGLKIDTRMLDNANFETKTIKSGDVLARTYIRYLEILDSIKLIEDLLTNLKGEINLQRYTLNLSPNSFVCSINEGWRGEVVQSCITDENGFIQKYKIKDPSFNNWFGLALAVRNNQISDFPVCNKSFNLSYCGFDL